jgi:hypothetical protein
VHYAAKAPPTLLGAGKRLQHWKSPSEIRCVCANSAAPSPVAITRAAALVALDPELAELADQIAEMIAPSRGWCLLTSSGTPAFAAVRPSASPTETLS